MDFLTTAVIISGILLGIYGLFHQFIVGGAVTMSRDPDEKNARLFLMSWVAHGAYLSLLGFLPALLLVFYEPDDPATLTSLIVVAIALVLLSIHVGVTGLKYSIVPLRVGWALQILHASLLLTAYLVYR